MLVRQWKTCKEKAFSLLAFCQLSFYKIIEKEWWKKQLASMKQLRNRVIITPEEQGKCYHMLDLFTEDYV